MTPILPSSRYREGWPHFGTEVVPRGQAPIPSGSARLEVDCVAGQSSVTTAWALSPLKLLTPRSRGPSVWAYLSSFGGGLVAGDQTSLGIRLGAAAQAFVSTQASTKVYRSPSGRPCAFRLHATLAPGSTLAVVPDAIQCFARSVYEQRQEFHLAANASLVLVDWVCSGRVALGERWAFSKYQTRTDIFVNGEGVLLESLLLDPEHTDLSATMGRFNCFALVLVLGAPLKPYAEDILGSVAAAPVKRRAPLAFSASPIRDGVLLRIGGERMEDVGAEIQRRLAFLKLVLLDDPWSRKW